MRVVDLLTGRPLTPVLRQAGNERHFPDPVLSPDGQILFGRTEDGAVYAIDGRIGVLRSESSPSPSQSYSAQVPAATARCPPAS